MYTRMVLDEMKALDPVLGDDDLKFLTPRHRKYQLYTLPALISSLSDKTIKNACSR